MMKRSRPDSGLDAVLAPVLDPLLGTFADIFNFGKDRQQKERQELESNLRARKDDSEA